MKKYREVVFQDAVTGKAFLTRSTVETNLTTRWEDGKEYPLLRLDVTSDSHPVYTGKKRAVHVSGRLEAFQKRYAKR